MRISDWSSDVCSSDLPLLVTRMQYRILAPGIALALVVPLTGSLTMPLVFAIARFVVGRQKMMSWSAMPCCPGLAGARAWLPYSIVMPSTGAVKVTEIGRAHV